MVFFWWLEVVIAYDCTFQFSDGTSVDLGNLQKTNPPDYQIKAPDGYKYIANICGQTFKICNGDKSAIASQWHSNGKCEAILGRQSTFLGGTGPKIQEIQTPDRQKGVSLTYYGGDYCIHYNKIERQVQYIIKCNPLQKLKFFQAYQPTVCNYVFQFQSKHACPSVFNSNTPKKPTFSYAKKAVKSLLVLLILYLIVGTLYKKCKQGES